MITLRDKEIDMLKHLLATITLATAVTFAGPAWSYDAEMAASYAKLFAPVEGAGAGKALHLMKPDAFLNKVNAKESLVTLDVRTPAEVSVFTSIMPGSLAIPISELFSEYNLARIPTDRTVVVLCKSGTRATAAATALRHIGFENVYILKGGFNALTGYMGSKEANTTPAPQPIQQPALQSKSTFLVPPHPSGRYPTPVPFPRRPNW